MGRDVDKSRLEMEVERFENKNEKKKQAEAIGAKVRGKVEDRGRLARIRHAPKDPLSVLTTMKFVL